MSVLVTGAAGFLGSHLAECLVLEGHDVVGLDSFDAFYDRAIKERNLTSLRAASLHGYPHQVRRISHQCGCSRQGEDRAADHPCVTPGIRGRSHPDRGRAGDHEGAIREWERCAVEYPADMRPRAYLALAGVTFPHVHRNPDGDLSGAEG